MDTQLFEHLQSYLTDHRRELFNTIVSNRTRHFTVVTEDVYQLHNTSAVIRSCDVFGIQDIHIVEEKNGNGIDKEIAMGAQKWVNLNTYSSMSSCLGSLKNNGYQLIATSPHYNSQMLEDFDITKKSAFLFGKENEGLSEIAINAADGFLKIPMYGFTESLNISVSVAIILQWTIARLKESDIEWQLSVEEKQEILLQWTKNTIKSVDKIVERYYEKS